MATGGSPRPVPRAQPPLAVARPGAARAHAVWKKWRHVSCNASITRRPSLSTLLLGQFIAFGSPAPNAIEADSLRDGLNQVIAEVRSGLVPPVGGRIIMMRSTGETAFVGFGSAVVRSSAQSGGSSQTQSRCPEDRGDAIQGCPLRANHRRQGVVGGECQGIVEGSSPGVRGCQGGRSVGQGVARRRQEAGRGPQTLVSRLESTDLYQRREKASCRRASTARRGSTKTMPGPTGCRSTPPAFPTLPQRPGKKCKIARFSSRCDGGREVIGRSSLAASPTRREPR